MDKRFKPKFNIKKGDKVVVITGDDKDLKKSRKVAGSISGYIQSAGGRCKHRYQAYQTFSTEYQGWDYETGSAHPYIKCVSLGCQIR